MADERFEMSVKAIRARYESWREFCETDDARVASDFWRDIGFLLSRLGECEEALRSSDAAHAEVVDENQQLLSRLGAAHEALEWLGDGNIDDVLEMMDYARNAANACTDGGHSSTADEPAHPEDDCDACGGRNITWSAPSTIWNAVMGSPNGIVCPQCFDRRAAAHGFVGLWRFEAGREPVDSAGEGRAPMADDFGDIEPCPHGFVLLAGTCPYCDAEAGRRT